MIWYLRDDRRKEIPSLSRNKFYFRQFSKEEFHIQRSVYNMNDRLINDLMDVLLQESKIMKIFLKFQKRKPMLLLKGKSASLRASQIWNSP